MEKEVSVSKHQLGQCARLEREGSERQPKRLHLQVLSVPESTVIALQSSTVPMEINRDEGESIVSRLSEPIVSRPIVTGSSSMAILHDESNLNQSVPRSRCLVDN